LQPLPNTTLTRSLVGAANAEVCPKAKIRVEQTSSDRMN